MSISSILEINSLALAKKYYIDEVSINHLFIACYDFLQNEESGIDLSEFQESFQGAIDLELSRKDRKYETPSLPKDVSVLIQTCQSINDVHNLLIKLSSDPQFNSRNTSNILNQPIEPKSKQLMANGFHVPLGEETGFLPKYMQDKRLSVVVISKYLDEDEKYIWDGPYNTADPAISTRLNQSQGRLFVTNQRILFWSDDTRKPHIGLYYLDIDDWKSSWMPLKSRGVALIADGRKVIFVANVNAVKRAEETFNTFRFKKKALEN